MKEKKLKLHANLRQRVADEWALSAQRAKLLSTWFPWQCRGILPCTPASIDGRLAFFFLFLAWFVYHSLHSDQQFCLSYNLENLECVCFFYNCNISIKDLRFEAVSEAVEKSHCYSSGFLKHMSMLVSLFVDLQRLQIVSWIWHSVLLWRFTVSEIL